MNTTSQRSTLDEQSTQLLAAHHRDTPLLLVNVWDAGSARAVESAGFGFVASSSRAIAHVLDEADDDSSDPDLIFAFLGRLARAVSVPVTADLEGGLGVTPAELVARLLEAGVVGCNLEDADHHGGGLLLDAERQATYLSEVRNATEKAGIHLVINARTDAFIRHAGDDDTQLEEAIRRGRLYLEAGADCVYPIAVTSTAQVAALVASVPGPLNFLAGRGGLSIAELTALGARRISLGSGMFQLMASRLDETLSVLARGAALDDL